MPLVTIAKLTFGTQNSKEIKYFCTSFDANTYVQSQSDLNNLEFNIESFSAYFDGTTYFNLIKANERINNNMQQLASDCAHEVFQYVYEFADTGGGQGPSIISYELTTDKPKFSYGTVKIYKDTSDTIFKIDAEVTVEASPADINSHHENRTTTREKQSRGMFERKRHLEKKEDGKDTQEEHQRKHPKRK